MKKSSLAALTYQAKIDTQIIDNARDKLLDIIGGAFSALATMDPEASLSVIDQLRGQEQSIKDVVDERKKNEEEYIKLMTANMGDSLQFEDEVIDE